MSGKKKDAEKNETKRCHPEPLTEIPSCPKCGRCEPTVIYEKRETDPHAYLEPLDYLRLKCRRCAYVWRVRPFDVNYEAERRMARAVAASFGSRSEYWRRRLA